MTSETSAIAVPREQVDLQQQVAPFPWFGGKRRVAEVVWRRFGADVQNYIEPFAGSLAVLLGRPSKPAGGLETVNDKDCLIANFWRAVTADPDEVAHYADAPINEADLHARHTWLCQQREFVELMKADPEHYDAKIAGWWVWGLCAWIGSGFCRALLRPELSCEPNKPKIDRGVGVHRKKPHIIGGGRGVHRQRPNLEASGVHRRMYLGRKQGVSASEHVATMMADLCSRLREVRVLCGDWTRAVSSGSFYHGRACGVFLDPPYDVSIRATGCYVEDGGSISGDVRQWAIENGDNPRFRIALCGYEGEHEMPESWSVHAWKTGGGFGAKKGCRGRDNAQRERIWFSPHCLPEDDGMPLFGGLK